MSIIYLDASALVKLYIQEMHSNEVRMLVDTAESVGTSILTYAEIASAMARATRLQLISDDSARSTWNYFVNDWLNFTRLKLSMPLTERAATLAWDYGLRGNDAMHLSAALTWQDALEERILLATFDHILWNAGDKVGIRVWPEELAKIR